MKIVRVFEKYKYFDSKKCEKTKTHNPGTAPTLVEHTPVKKKIPACWMG